MKKIIFTFLLAAGFFTCIAQSTMLLSNKDSLAPKADPKNFIIMKEGILIIVKNGTPYALSSNIVLKDGTNVFLNGTYLSKGEKKILMDGDSLYLNGRIILNKQQLAYKQPESDN
jgi:hypothetical protein